MTKVEYYKEIDLSLFYLSYPSMVISLLPSVKHRFLPLHENF